MSSIKKRVMTEILKDRNPVWLKDYPYEKTLQDGLFSTKNGDCAIYKVTKRNGDILTNYQNYYLEKRVLDDMLRWHQNKGLDMVYFIIWRNHSPREYGFKAFDVVKFMMRHKGHPPVTGWLLPERTFGGNGDLVWKNIIMFDEEDILKEGTVIIPIETNLKTRRKWQPRNLSARNVSNS